MRTQILILLTSILFITQSTQQSPELKEANDLSVSVVKLFKENKFDEAIPLAKRALEIREKLLPPSDPLILNALGNLGDLYNAKGDYKAAKKTFERLLALQEQQFGPTDVKLASTLDRLAVIHYREGNVSKAEEMYKRALALRESTFGPDHVEVANSLFSLGHFYRLSSKYEPALNAYRRSLSIYGRAKGVELAAFERARAGMTCLAYETGKREIFKELEAIPKQLVPGIDVPKPEDILNGKALDLPKPEISQRVRELRLSGTVVIRVQIDEEGKVLNARDICQGPPLLTEPAVKAALKARFSPTLLYGQPVKVTGVIQYNFRFRP